MSKFAWVTLSTNDTYSLGALVLAHSLRRTGTAHQLVVLVTPGVSESMRGKLKDVYNVVQEVNVMDSQDAANLSLLARPELGVTFTKLHCWRLVQFEKCVFLDADTLVLQNCDELFEREELSAAPDVSWPDCFNSGVFVYKPNLDTFAKLTEFAVKEGSFDGGDQGLLNSYFADWAHKDIAKHLPFVYNVTAYAAYCYLPAFKQFRDKIKILHFAGKLKPWLVNFNSESKTACTPSDYAHAADLIQLWWNIFCDNVHQNLTDNMDFWPEIAQWNFYEQIYQEQNHNHSYHYQHQSPNQHQREHSEGDHFPQESLYSYFENVKEFHDPWEDYYENLENQSQEIERNIAQLSVDEEKAYEHVVEEEVRRDEEQTPQYHHDCTEVLDNQSNNSQEQTDSWQEDQCLSVEHCGPHTEEAIKESTKHEAPTTQYEAIHNSAQGVDNSKANVECVCAHATVVVEETEQEVTENEVKRMGIKLESM